MTSAAQSQTLFGHPAGLYTLFFAEMWERFSFYGMRALLNLYMVKGFLAYDDGEAYATYGAYTALVYMTPFFGGILADKILGPRRAVVYGGLLMAAGHLLMTNEHRIAFFLALALLIVGNGFFKPNISTMVGQLYAATNRKRDGGFTVFYMGVNLGAAISPLLCGYIGEIYGWHWGFGLATIGMLTGLAVFVLPGSVARIIIMAGALLTAGALLFAHPNNIYLIAINLFVGAALLAAAAIAWIAIGRGGLPSTVGEAPPDELSAQPARLFSPRTTAVYLGGLSAVPFLALVVSGFALFTADGQPLTLISPASVKDLSRSGNPLLKALSEVLQEASKPAGLGLLLAGAIAAGYLGIKTARLERIPRRRMYVVFVLTFASMLFWAFFEQAGSSVNNFTDRNVDRVFHTASMRLIAAAEVGRTIRLQPTQAQLGYKNGDQTFTMNALAALRTRHGAQPDFAIDWRVGEDNIGMSVAERADEIPASILQSVNAIYILILGLAFTALWTFLGARKLDPSTPNKFALGLLQLGLGFCAFWHGASCADERGMVWMGWLLLGYLLQTTGELCISPVGLSMVTKLSPRDLVSTVMGTWFLATAFSQFLAAIIAQFTRVGGGDGAKGQIPPPIETVAIYGGVFGRIAIAAMISALLFFALAPILKVWMHEEDTSGEPEAA